MSKSLMTAALTAFALSTIACQKDAPPPVSAPAPQPVAQPAPRPEVEFVIDTVRLAEEAKAAITAENAEAVAAELTRQLEAELARMGE